MNRTVALVARRELVTRMMTRSNIISTVVLMAVIVGLGLLAKALTGDEDAPPPMTIGLDPAVTEIAAHLLPPAHGASVETVELEEAAARSALLDEDADEPLAAWVTGDAASPRVVFAEEPDPQVLGLVESAAQAVATARLVADLGGDPASVGAALAAVTVTADVLEPKDGFDGGQWAVATVTISLLLFALIGSGATIAMGVVEEKTSRVVEILLATIRPSQLLAGKILGIGAFGLLQMVLLAGTVAGTVALLGVFPDIEIDLGLTFVATIAWFLLGFGIFALLFGGFAALVSRQEDIGAVTTPLMFALFVPFYTTMFLVPSQPDSTLVKVLSQIPLFSPFMMPTRASMGVLEPWEMPLAMVIAAACIPLLVSVAGRVYRRAVLHTGGRMGLGEALRGAR